MTRRSYRIRPDKLSLCGVALGHLNPCVYVSLRQKGSLSDQVPKRIALQVEHAKVLSFDVCERVPFVLIVYLFVLEKATSESQSLRKKMYLVKYRFTMDAVKYSVYERIFLFLISVYSFSCVF